MADKNVETVPTGVTSEMLESCIQEDATEEEREKVRDMLKAAVGSNLPSY